jgi:hypothetical protein
MMKASQSISTLFVFSLFLLAHTLCYSQNFNQSNSGRVFGKIADKTEPVPFANVIVMTADSVMLQGTTTSETGEFTMSNIPFGKKLMQVSYLGYETTTIEVYVDSLENNVGTVYLQANAYSLEEVTITASRPVFSMKGSSLITNVSTSLLSSIGTANDVIEKIPGITMYDGSITVFGKGTPIIYINNRKVIDKAELERLQSTDIKTVELISNPGAKYDAEGKAVLIIKKKDNSSNGISLQASEQLKQGNYLGDTENISLSYTKDNLNLFASYYHTYQKNQTDERAVYSIHADTLWKQNIHRNDTYSYRTNQVTGGFDWTINKKHAVGGQYQGYFSSTSSDVNGNEQVFANNITYDDVMSISLMKDKPYQHLANAFYQGSFSDMFNLQLDFDYLKNHTESNQNTQESSQIIGNRQVNINSQSDFELYAGKLTATSEIEKIGTLEYGSEYNRINGSGFLINPEGYVQSNVYTNEEEKAAAFINYGRTFGKLELNAGIRYEYAHERSMEDSTGNVKVDKKYSDFYPNISLSREVGKVQMSLDMNRRTRRPSFSELNDNNVYVNRFLTQKGNPYLEKEDIYDVNYRMRYKMLNFSLGYTYIKNPISFNFQSSERTSAESILSFINYPKYQRLSALATINSKVGFWQPQLTVGIIQPFFTANYNGETIKHNKTDISVKFYNDIVFLQNYIFSVNYSYQNDYDDYMTRFESYQRLDLGLRKSFFNKSLTINLQARDIFNWMKEKTNISIDNYNLNMNKKQETRYITLSIRYLFNNYEKKYRGRNAASDDIDRL